MVPSRCYCFFQSQNQSVGEIGNSVFSYKPHNVKDIWIDVNGSRCPSLPWNVDFSKKQFVRPYRALYGDNWSNNSSIIDQDLWGSHYTIWTFDMLQPLQCNSIRSKQLGSCKLNVEFTVDTNEVLKVFLLVLTQEYFELTSQRTVVKAF